MSSLFRYETNAPISDPHAQRIIMHRGIEAEEQEDPCAICQASLTTQKVTELACGHEFHTSCLKESLVNNLTSCGLCRANIAEEDRARINQDPLIIEKAINALSKTVEIAVKAGLFTTYTYALLAIWLAELYYLNPEGYEKEKELLSHYTDAFVNFDIQKFQTCMSEGMQLHMTTSGMINMALINVTSQALLPVSKTIYHKLRNLTARIFS